MEFSPLSVPDVIIHVECAGIHTYYRVLVSNEIAVLGGLDLDRLFRPSKNIMEVLGLL